MDAQDLRVNKQLEKREIPRRKSDWILCYSKLLLLAPLKKNKQTKKKEKQLHETHVLLTPPL